MRVESWPTYWRSSPRPPRNTSGAGTASYRPTAPATTASSPRSPQSSSTGRSAPPNSLPGSCGESSTAEPVLPKGNHMCGIVGYVGTKPAVPILVDGLARLEYRGYDSAGVAVLGSSELRVHKDA